MKKSTYPTLTKYLHWSIVTLIAIQFLTAWIMPELRRQQSPSELLNLHMSFGVIVVPLSLALLLMHFLYPVAAIETKDALWQDKLAKAMHYLLYVLLLVLPVSGLAYAVVRGVTVTIFGLFQLPTFGITATTFWQLFGELHSALATVIGLLVIGHAGAALYHHFFLRDRVLKRMLPGSNQETGGSEL